MWKRKNVKINNGKSNHNMAGEVIPYKICSTCLFILIAFLLPELSYSQQRDSSNIRHFKTTLDTPKYVGPTETTRKVQDSNVFVVWVLENRISVKHRHKTLSITTVEELNEYIKSNLRLVQKDGIEIKSYTDTQAAGKFEEVVHVLKNNGIYHFSMISVQEKQ